ncbi:hypothetical protein [Shewanella sp. NIFS-20-20]|uniref:hypothetical protein n=1 Tax=Shewanella sp. NIFS-20-20 TaxID=2853806 RepID=UPI003529A89D
MAVLVVFVGFYWLLEASETSRKEASVAIGVYGAYLVIYLGIGPFPAATSIYMGKLYSWLPMLSVGAILFPQFNPSSPEGVTRVLGWMGLTAVIVILSYFKLFVW